jgi:hypothetical protein
MFGFARLEDVVTCPNVQAKVLDTKERQRKDVPYPKPTYRKRLLLKSPRGWSWK